MGLCSVFTVAPPREGLLALPSTIGILAMLAASLAFAADSSSAPPPPASPSIESQTRDVFPERDTKKLEKYSIERIGRRDIGHGFNLYSLKREHELGLSLAAAFDHTTKIIRDPVINEYVNRVAQKIIGNSDAEISFTIKVIDSGDIPRAYGLPGGFLYVDSALLTAADDEAELACLMAHEIAHVAARHATRALSRKRLYGIANSVALFTGPAGIALEDAGGIAGPLSLKKFLRDTEYEADLLGIEYAYTAGYDPQALMGALEKLHALEAARTAELSKIPGYHFATKIPFHSKIARGFSNYPMTEERILRLQSEIPAFLPNRKDYILNTDEFEEMKSRLLASEIPTLRHHAGDNDSKGPVLRRTSDDTPDVDTNPDVASNLELHRSSESLLPLK